MLTGSALYADSLPFPHARTLRVQVLRGSTVLLDTDDPANGGDALLPVGGTVRAALSGRVTRSLDAQFPSQWWPANDGDPFDPKFGVLKIWAGTRFPDGSREIFPIFTGRIQDADRPADGSFRVTASDRAADVVAFQFEQPELSLTGNTVVQEIRRLILQAFPAAVFGTNDVNTAILVPPLMWDTDRGKALDDLAQSLQARWYTLGDGSFVIRQYPYQGGTSVVSLSDGYPGTLSGAEIRKSRFGGANSVTVVSERMDGTAPVRYTARDIVPSSPTYYFGDYGKVSQVVKVQTPLDNAGAQALAGQLLSAQIAVTETWDVSCVPDYRLEPGDTIGLAWRGNASTQVIDTITYPLTLQSAAMTIGTRASVAAPVAT